MTSTAEPASGAGRRLVVIDPARFSWRTLTDGLRELAHYGGLLSTLTAHRIRVRYKQSALGLAWAVLQPTAMTAIFVAVFSLVGGVATEGVPYALFAYAALLPWSFFATAISTATNGLVSHTQLVTKVYFPREILPLSYVIAAGFDFLVASTVLAALMAYHGVYPPGPPLAAIAIFLLLFALATALALVLSAVQVRFRDIGLAMPLLLQLLFFASPIVYPLSAVPERFRAIYTLNPIAGLIDNFRTAVLHARLSNADALAMSTLIVFVSVPAAYILFKRVEATMADTI